MGRNVAPLFGYDKGRQIDAHSDRQGTASRVYKTKRETE